MLMTMGHPFLYVMNHLYHCCVQGHAAHEGHVLSNCTYHTNPKQRKFSL